MDRKIEASAAMLTLYRAVTVKRAKRSVSSHNEFISVTSTADDVCSVSAGFKPRHQTDRTGQRSGREPTLSLATVGRVIKADDHIRFHRGHRGRSLNRLTKPGHQGLEAWSRV